MFQFSVHVYMLLITMCDGFPRSCPADRSSKPPKANSSWQSHGKGAGVPHSGMHLHPDLPSHNLLTNEGWCYGGRWPHTTRGEGSPHISIICFAFSLVLVLLPRKVQNSSIPDWTPFWITFPLLLGILTWGTCQRCNPSTECISEC